jgi:type I restriction enzyme, S subunit
LSQENGLPLNWAIASLAEIGEWYGGGTPSKANPAYWKDGTVPWFSPKDMKQFRLIDSEDHIASFATEQTNVKPVPKGTILIVVRSGILVRTLPVAICEVPATMNQDMKGLRPFDGIDADFVAYFLTANEQSILRECSKDGTTVASIEVGRLKNVQIPIAPLNEQRRIVAKIEELFSDLDAAVAALERVQAKLKRYRAAVLKVAVEGKLTAEWRAQRPNTEPASALLARILAERRRRWEEEQLAKFTALGKTPPTNWQKKYVEPTPPDTSGLPELPQGWCWARMEQLISFLKNGYFQPPTEATSGPRLLRINAVRPMRVNLDEMRYIDCLDSAGSEYLVADGDLLFTRYNGSVDLLGVVGMVRNCTEAVLHPDKLIRVKAVLGQPLPAYLELACNVGESRRHIVGRARTTAGQTGISGGDIRDMPVPLPPLVEQERVVAEAEQHLSVLVATEGLIEQNLQRATRLRQGILREAFEGRLVPQDPTDEPASELLRRIREQGNGRQDRPRKKGKP